MLFFMGSHRMKLLRKCTSLKMKVDYILKCLVSDIRYMRRIGFYYLFLDDKQKYNIRHRYNNVRKYGKRYIKNKRHIKQRIIKRDGLLCRGCKVSKPYNKLTIDHMTRVSDGGTSRMDNLQLLCVECHRRKDITKL